MSRPRRPGLGGDRGGNSLGATLAGLVRSVVGIALIGGFLYLFYVPLFGPKQPAPALDAPQAAAPQPVASAPTPTAPPGSSTPGTSGTTGTVELTTTASIQKQQLTVAKFNQRRLVRLYGEVTKAFDEWEKELAAWEKEGPPILTGEAGKRIAADVPQVKRVRGLIRHERPTADELATARKLAEELISPIRESLANAEDASTPAEAITSNLNGLQTQARKARDSYREARDAVKAILAQAKDKAPSEKTLQEVIAALDQADAASRVADIDAAEQKAKDEGAKRVAEEKARLAKEVANAEAARIKGEADRTRQQAEMAAAKRKQEEEFAAAKSIEEQTVRLKEAEQAIARQKALAEQKRQGSLKTGSVWKGTVRDGSFDCEGTLTVDSRLVDEIKCSLVYESPGGGLKGRVNFKGKVTGTSIRLIPTAHAPESDVHSCVYNPAAGTLSGQGTNRSFNLRLTDE